jgi:hypothetical protein
MNWIAEDIEELLIKNIKSRVDNGQVIITWDWPENVDFVFCERFDVSHELPFEQKKIEPMKSITRHEYREKNGYRFTQDKYGSQSIRIYASLKVDGVTHCVKQLEGNIVHLVAAKGKVSYAISYSGHLLSRLKTVEITVDSEVYVSKDSICYVKCINGVPSNKEEGVVYPLIEDLQPGRHVLSAFEIDKKEFIKLFLTDIKIHGNRFELILR